MLLKAILKWQTMTIMVKYMTLLRFTPPFGNIEDDNDVDDDDDERSKGKRERERKEQQMNK